MAGRKQNKYKAEKFQCYVPALTMRDLEWLINEGYGSNVGEVGLYLMQRGVDDLKRAGFIAKKTTQNNLPNSSIAKE